MDGQFPEHGEEGTESGAIIALYESSRKETGRPFFDVADYEMIIEHYIERFDLPAANRAVRQALDQHPGSLDIKYQQAHLAYISGDADTCLHLVSTLRLIQPEDLELDMLRAEALAMKGEHQRALNNFQRIRKEYAEADQFKLNHLIAKLYMELGQQLDAIPYWKFLVDEVPTYEHAYIEMSDCYQAAELPLEALKMLDQALDRSPYSIPLWMEKGNIHFEQSDFEEAASAYEFACAIDEDFLPGHLSLASVRFNQGDYTTSLRLYSEALEKDDEDAVVLCCIGECYEQMKDMERAETYFRRSLQLDPEHAEARMGLCVVHESRGEHLKALRQIENAVGLCPDTSEYWHVYGTMLARLQDYEASMAAFERAFQLDEGDVEPYLSMLDMQIEHGHYGEALQRIQKGYETFGDSKGIYLRGIRLLHLLGKRQDCIALLEMTKERCPEALEELQQHYPAIYSDDSMTEHL